MWELREGPGQCEIVGVKHYWFDGKLTCAGMPRGVMASAGDGEHYWYTAAPADQSRERRAPQAEAELRRHATETKYRHGNVMPDGRVMPFIIREW